MSMASRRVLITREEADSRIWAHRLVQLGAEPVVLPCIVCELLGDAETRGRLQAAIAACDWVLISSARGAAFSARLLGGALPAGTRVAAIGPQSAAAAKASFGRVDVVAQRSTGAQLGDELSRLLRGSCQRVLVIGARGGRTDADAALSRSGILVSRVDVYRTVPVPRATVRRDLAAEGIQDILLASPSAVVGLCNSAVVPAHARIITIGATTSSAAAAAGLTIAAEARRPSLDGMLEAIA